MSLAVYCDASFTSNDDWESFVLAHFMRHETYRDSINATITQSKIDNIRKERPDWMLDHAQEHLDTASVLGISANPYIAEADLTDPDQYAQWMYYHRTEHDLFDLALGL